MTNNCDSYINVEVGNCYELKSITARPTQVGVAVIKAKSYPLTSSLEHNFFVKPYKTLTQSL